MDDDSQYNDNEDDEIDMIVKSIPFLVSNDEVKVEENGTNGIGWFNFSYRVQNSYNKNAYDCSINSVTTTVIDPLPTSCTCKVFSSSLWAMIALAIMLLITLLVTIIISICIVRNISMKLKETKERNACDCDGEHTCPVLVHLLSYC